MPLSFRAAGADSIRSPCARPESYGGYQEFKDAILTKEHDEHLAPRRQCEGNVQRLEITNALNDLRTLDRLLQYGFASHTEKSLRVSRNGS